MFFNNDLCFGGGETTQLSNGGFIQFNLHLSAAATIQKRRLKSALSYLKAEVKVFVKSTSDLFNLCRHSLLTCGWKTGSFTPSSKICFPQFSILTPAYKELLNPTKSHKKRELFHSQKLANIDNVQTVSACLPLPKSGPKMRSGLFGISEPEINHVPQ